MDIIIDSQHHRHVWDCPYSQQIEFDRLSSTPGSCTQDFHSLTVKPQAESHPQQTCFPGPRHNNAWQMVSLYITHMKDNFCQFISIEHVKIVTKQTAPAMPHSLVRMKHSHLCQSSAPNPTLGLNKGSISWQIFQLHKEPLTIQRRLSHNLSHRTSKYIFNAAVLWSPYFITPFSVRVCSLLLINHDIIEWSITDPTCTKWSSCFLQKGLTLISLPNERAGPVLPAGRYP